MINYDKYYILTGDQKVKCESLLEVAGRLGDVFDKGRDIATVIRIRKDAK